MHLLEKDTAGRPLAESSGYSVSISDNWSVNGLPNGGYMMAVLAKAMLQESAKPKMAILTASFIARSAPGDARVLLERIAASSQFERFEARLLQSGSEKIRALGTFIDEEKDCTVDRYESAAPEVAARPQCIPIPQMPNFPLYDQMDVQLDPDCAGWMNNRLADRSEFRGWIRFRDERSYDERALLVVADAFPPPVYASQSLAAWVPTIELSVNIRKPPGSEWLKCVFRTRFITCGLLEEDGEIWDETGKLIALSRQIAQYRPFA